MFKCPVHTGRMENPGGTERRGNLGASGMKGWWGCESSVLPGPRTAGRVGPDGWACHWHCVEKMSISLPNSSLWLLVATACTWWPHSSTRSLSPGPTSAVSPGWAPRKIRVFSSTISQYEKVQPPDPQLSPKVTAIFKAHSGHLLFEAHHVGTFLYQLQ